MPVAADIGTNVASFTDLTGRRRKRLMVPNAGVDMANFTGATGRRSSAPMVTGNGILMVCKLAHRGNFIKNEFTAGNIMEYPQYVRVDGELVPVYDRSEYTPADAVKSVIHTGSGVIIVYYGSKIPLPAAKL